MNSQIQLKRTASPLLITLTLLCFGLSPVAQAGSATNTSLGVFAFHDNTTGTFDTGIGFRALEHNSGGALNTAVGSLALNENTTGTANTAIGADALAHETTGISNTASGNRALFRDTTGRSNTAIGTDALAHNSTGSFNTAVGYGAGDLTTGNGNIDIENPGVAGESFTTRIGRGQDKTFIAGIHGATVSGAAVFVNAQGQLGTVPSSQRFKEEIKPMDTASETILCLKPISFRYKKEIDPEGTPQFGLVAEEVEKVNPDLVIRDAGGKAYTVRYDAVNAMLLNEFLKEHRKVENLQDQFQATAAQHEKEIAALTATVKEQAAQIQKVSAQLEASKPVPQVVNNP